VDAIKAFFVEENVDRQFNVPTFVRVVDNRGNERLFAPPEEAKVASLISVAGRQEIYTPVTCSP